MYRRVRRQISRTLEKCPELRIETAQFTVSLLNNIIQYVRPPVVGDLLSFNLTNILVFLLTSHSVTASLFRSERHRQVRAGARQ